MASREHLDPTSQRQALIDERLQAQIRLARWLSHDLNNVFMVILNYAQLLQESEDKDAIERDLKAIENSAHKGLHLTQSLLRFSRGAQSGPPVEIELHQVLQQSHDRWQKHLGGDHPLTFNLSDQTFRVLLPHQRIEEIILPLLDNAKESQQEEGTIELSTEYVELSPQETWDRIQAGPYVCIQIKDQGRGIPPDMLEVALEPMTTHHPRTQHKGMGLALVYSMLRQVSGWLKIDSTEDQGTEVSVYLPILQYSSSGSQSASHNGPREFKHVMLCIPSMSFQERDQLCSELEDQGYVVLEAEDMLEIEQIQRRFQEEIHALITEADAITEDKPLDMLRATSPRLHALFFSSKQPPHAEHSWQHHHETSPSIEHVKEALEQLYQTLSQRDASSPPEDPRR